MHKTDIQEELYIWKRKIKAFFSSLVYYVCRVFPIDPDKIVMWTFEGQGGYGCSPKYIAEELLRRNREGKTAFKIIWLLEDTEKEFPNEIQKVKNTLWRRAYHLSTAGFWIANTRTFYGTRKRKGTIYLQTWHGTVAVKPIGKYRGDRLPKMAYLVSEYDSKMIDYALSGSRWCTNMWPEGLIYDGVIVETGTPRCDVLFRGVDEKHIQLRKEYHIPLDANVLLYAPTFRGGSQNKNRQVEAESSSLDFERLIEALESRFGGTWYVFLRLHPQLAAQMDAFPMKKNNERLIDVSQRPDDLKDYVADRGDFMFQLDEIPFSVACDNEELVNHILTFDSKVYDKKRLEFIKRLGIMEDGRASERVVDLVVKLRLETENKT